MQMSKVNQYFAEFVNPRTCNVSQAISSKGVVDIFDTLGLEKPEVSPLLSDKFLNGLRDKNKEI